MKAPAVVARFWPKVDKSGDCWMWQGSKDGSGYRMFKEVRTVRAHRFAYEALVGPIPAGLQLDHLCRNRGCVNPAHLEPVTATENIRRGDVGIVNRSKTHCPKGHPYDEDNTLWSAKGRACRSCGRRVALGQYYKNRDYRIAYMAARRARLKEMSHAKHV